MKKLISTKKVTKSFAFSVKSVDEQNHRVQGVFSNEMVDRHGEVVVQSGWNLDNYRINPVVLWAHNSGEPPIAKMLSIGVNAANELEGEMQFAFDEYPFAATIFNLIKGGYQRAFSVGFSVNNYEDGGADQPVFLTEQELYEVSCVPVPANALALAKQKGVDVTEAEKAEGVVEPEATKDEPQSEEEKPVTAEKAVHVLTTSNKETLQSAIRTLTEVLHAGSEADSQEGSQGRTPQLQLGGEKKVSVRTINSAIRQLVKARRVLINQ